MLSVCCACFSSYCCGDADVSDAADGDDDAADGDDDDGDGDDDDGDDDDGDDNDAYDDDDGDDGDDDGGDGRDGCDDDDDNQDGDDDDEDDDDDNDDDDGYDDDDDGGDGDDDGDDDDVHDDDDDDDYYCYHDDDQDDDDDGDDDDEEDDHLFVYVFVLQAVLELVLVAAQIVSILICVSGIKVHIAAFLLVSIYLSATVRHSVSTGPEAEVSSANSGRLGSRLASAPRGPMGMLLAVISVPGLHWTPLKDLEDRVHLRSQPCQSVCCTCGFKAVRWLALNQSCPRK